MIRLLRYFKKNTGWYYNLCNAVIPICLFDDETIPELLTLKEVKKEVYDILKGVKSINFSSFLPVLTGQLYGWFQFKDAKENINLIEEIKKVVKVSWR